MYDTVQGLWKYQATSFWPSFKTRNAISDYGRALSKGPFNPLTDAGLGIKGLQRSASSTVDLGHAGKFTGADLWDLAEAWRVKGGYFEEALAGSAGWRKKLKILSADEDMRRIGYFAGRVQAGYGFDEASKMTREVFFDYGALAPWEKSYAKRLLPWWSFRRNNMAFQVDRLLQQPYWTAAQMRLLRNRDRLSQEDEGWVPDRLKGNMGIVINEPGITSILYGLDTGGVQDLVGMLDLAGHPKGTLNSVLDQLGEETSPLIKEMLIQGGKHILEYGEKGPGDEELVAAPKDIEKLPQGMLDFLEVKQVKERKYGAVRNTWMMPRGAKRHLGTLRIFSETMKWFRYDNTKTVSENALNNAVASLSGLSKREITEVQVREMLLRERLDSMRDKLLDSGFMKGDKITREGSQTKLGREFAKTLHEYMIAARKRQAEDDRRRLAPRETSEAETVQPVQP
jgi:hypothetical protein